MAGYSEEFETFWKLYPRKIGKQAAWKVWQRQINKSDLLATLTADTINDALRRQVEAGHLGTIIAYVPHPRTWLHQGRWEDEIEQRHSKAGYAAPTKGHFDGIY